MKLKKYTKFDFVFLIFYWVMPLFRFLLTSACLSVQGLAPLPFDLESWFFAWALVLGIGKNVFFKFLNFYFFTELCPFFRFLMTSACLSVHGLTPLPFDLESWFFAWALVLAIGKKRFFQIFIFYFFTELCPFFDFPLFILCNFDAVLWKIGKW